MPPIERPATARFAEPFATCTLRLDGRQDVADEIALEEHVVLALVRRALRHRVAEGHDEQHRPYGFLGDEVVENEFARPIDTQFDSALPAPCRSTSAG